MSWSTEVDMESLRTGGLIHRLDRVAHQVHQRLLDLDRVREDLVFGVVQAEQDFDARILGRGRDEFAGALNEIVKAALLNLVGLGARDELAKVRDDLPRPMQLRRGLVESFLDRRPGRLGLLRSRGRGQSRRWRILELSSWTISVIERCLLPTLGAR